MTIGEKIQKCRKGRKMSQEELADRLAVSRQAVSKWELNESIPDTENVIQLGKIFDVSLDYLLKPEIEEYEEENEKRILNRNEPILDGQIEVKNEQVKVKSRFRHIGWIAYLVIIFIIAALSCARNTVGTGFVTIINVTALFGIGYLISLMIKALKKYIGKSGD